MANPEHVAILRQGVEVWNRWRQAYPEIHPRLSKVSSLHGVDLSEADFRKANFSHTDLRSVNLRGANFSEADLTRARLSNCSLRQANLSYANLTRAIFRSTSFMAANLIGVKLGQAEVNGGKLEGANLTEAWVGSTLFGNIDLSKVRGLETVRHSGPSTIGIDTIYLSKGKLPEVFLRGAGVPASFLEMMPLIANRSIEYYTCFISYSSTDDSFAKRLHADLQSKGVRCWFAPHDMRIGDKIRPRIDESILLYDKLLLVLSENSVASQWVEHEVETALGKELEGKPNVLFPIRLDDKVMESKTGWASHIRLTRHTGDFTNWKNHDDYQQAFNRLLRDLKAEAETTEV